MIISTRLKFLWSFTLFLMLVGVSAFAQEKSITGKVTDLDTNEPLPGVNILVKGTTQGTVTDVEGNFKINVP